MGKPRELREVSVVADDPAELRRVAQFFAEAASIVESRRDLHPRPTAVWHLTGTFITGTGPIAGPMNRAI